MIADGRVRAANVWSAKLHTKSKRPGRNRGVAVSVDRESYWLPLDALGVSNRVQPVVFTSRNNGVLGGSNAGVRKFVSKLYPRVGGLYTVVQHLNVLLACRL